MPFEALHFLAFLYYYEDYFCQKTSGNQDWASLDSWVFSKSAQVQASFRRVFHSEDFTDRLESPVSLAQPSCQRKDRLQSSVALGTIP